MPKIYPGVNTFNAGEVSQLIFNREDISKYKSACLTLENAFPLVEGGAKKMPGTYYAGQINSTPGTQTPGVVNPPYRLAPFQFSTDQGAILEISENQIRIWSPTTPGTWTLGLVESGGLPIALVTPYLQADLFTLDCGTQSADVLWIFHPNYPPACVERLGPSSWQYTVAPPGGPPVVAGDPAYRGTSDVINTGFSGNGVAILQITQAYSAVMVTNGPFATGQRVYINECAGMVEVNEGEFFLIPALNNGDSANFGGSISNGGGSVSGYILTVTGITTGTIEVGMLVSGPNVAPNTIITAFLSGTGGVGNYQVNIPQFAPAAAMTSTGGYAYYLIPVVDGFVASGSISGTTLTITSMIAGVVDPGVGIWFLNPIVQNGTIITGQLSGTPGGVGTYSINIAQTVTTQTISTIPVASESYLPYEGGGFAVAVIPMFVNTGDYPACGTFYQGRLIVGGSDNNPTQINGSTIDDFPNFITDPNEDDYAFQFTLTSTLLDQIINIIGTPNALIIGTAGGAWAMTGAGGPGTSISQSSVNNSKQSTLGVSQLQPQLVGDSAIFVSRSARQVTFLTFDFVSNKWNPIDLTRLNRQITLGPNAAQSGVIQTAFQTEPYPIFWAVRADGQLIGLVFNPQDQVFAWFRVNMLPEGGIVESVACISGQNEEDMLVVVVNRAINGNVVRYMEYFYPQELFNQLSNAFFVHCGLQLNLGPPVAITGITNANPPTVTAPGQNFANGTFVQIANVLGMTEINQDKTQAYQVINTNPGAGTFQLAYMDTTLFGAYTSGGTALPVTNQVSGMSYLMGQAVVAVGDCAIILPRNPPTIVTSDIVTFPYYCSQITIGLPYKMTVQPMNPVLTSQASTTHGMKQKVNRATISLYQSLGGEYGADLKHMYPIVYEQST